VDEDLEAVWKALADPTRRRILDLLRDGPRTTTAIAAAFPVTRFAIMKHLRILEESGLVLAERRGRERWNHLNAVPLRRIYERWISGYANHWAVSLLTLKRHLERPGARQRRRSR
jgi:DNA-binding transcriptional ArsR family regulator